MYKGDISRRFEHTSVFGTTYYYALPDDEVGGGARCSAVFSIKAAQRDSSVIHAQFDFSHLHYEDPTGLGWVPVFNVNLKRTVRQRFNVV